MPSLPLATLDNPEYFIPSRSYAWELTIAPETGDTLNPTSEWRVVIEQPYVADDIYFDAATSPALTASVHNTNGVKLELTLSGAITNELGHANKMLVERGPLGNAEALFWQELNIDPSNFGNK